MKIAGNGQKFKPDPLSAGFAALRAATAFVAVALLVVDHFAGLSRWVVVGSALVMLLLIALSVPIAVSASKKNAISEAEARRKEEENLYLAAIVRSSEDAIFSLDLDGCVTAWNEGASRLYGFEPEEAIGQRLTELTIPPERAKELGATFRRVTSGGWEEFESERLTKGGERIRVSSRTFPIRDAGGEVVGMSISTHDVNGNPRQDEELEKKRLKHVWQTRIREALAESRFVFWGQPVFDARTGEVDHTELLIRMMLDGEVIADSTRPVLLFESGLPTRYYLPKTDVRMDLLVPTDSQTGCPYKGFARYWNVVVGDEVHEDLGWSYPTPLPEAQPVAGLVCFYNERVDLEVDGVALERPKTKFS